MHQFELFEENQRKEQRNTIANIASFPHRSPFRYPGGKTWLIPYIRQWLNGSIRETTELSPRHPRSLIEPFAGGGIISLTTIAEKLVDRAIMIERDEEVASVWQTIFDETNCHWLSEEIINFEVNQENVLKYLERTNLELKERAFRTLLRNRMNRGGILAPGAGLLKNGENGKGLRSRWYPATLMKRIVAIANLRDRIQFISGDGIEFLRNYKTDNSAVFFIDPPYTAGNKKAGKRLYTYSEINHIELFEIVNTLQGDFLMTYDDNEEVIKLAARFHFDIEPIPMKNTHHVEKMELLLGKNLNWVRQMPNKVTR